METLPMDVLPVTPKVKMEVSASVVVLFTDKVCIDAFTNEVLPATPRLLMDVLVKVVCPVTAN